LVTVNLFSYSIKFWRHLPSNWYKFYWKEHLLLFVIVFLIPFLQQTISYSQLRLQALRRSLWGLRVLRHIAVKFRLWCTQHVVHWCDI
jgi:hypothetical protein